MMGKNLRFGGVCILAVFAAALYTSPARAVLNASETVTASQVGPNSYEYNVTLHNTGDTPISSFWFGWIPFYDLLPSTPTTISSPSGWNGINAPDIGVASIQWTTTSSPLAGGQSLSGFKFDSPDSPTVMNGTGFAGYPITEAYAYAGPPDELGTGGVAFSATVQTPEPTALALLVVPASFLLRRSRRR